MKKNLGSQSIGAQMITAADGTIFTGAVSVLYTIDNGTQTSGGGTAPAHEGNGFHSYTPLQAETNGDHIAFTFTGTGAITSTVQVYTSFPQSQDHTTPIDNIDTVVDLIKSDTSAILIDTNDLQTNQGGWLTATGFNTVVPPSVAQFNARSIPSADYFIVTDYTAPDNAGITQIQTDIADVPTVAEFNARTLPSASYSQFDYTLNEVSANTVKVNGATVLGNGTGANLWRGS